ncbi:type IV pilus assembly protein PilM [Patescibacteria group bacterium]|nr:type IV pilus assembly protein PilM [Patescibacteria group bacterium]
MSFFDSLFKKKEKSVLGVDIGSSSLKVVQLRKDHDQAVLETYGEMALGPYGGSEVGQATNLSVEQITETLRDLLRESKVTTRNCGVSIPYARSLLIMVKLPYRKDPKEQKTVIELEARKYIPIPVSEVQLDWFILPKPEQEQVGNILTPAVGSSRETIEALLVAVHNDELLLLQNIVANVGLASTFYEIEIFSTIRAVVDEPVRPVMVLDIGAASTKIYIIEHGVVALSHALSTGSQDITRAISIASNVPIQQAEILKKQRGLQSGGSLGSSEAVFSRIFSEARRVLIQFETAHKKPVTAIVLTGGGGVTKQLSDYAKHIFSIDVHVANPFKKVQAPAFMRPILEEIGPEFAVAVGLALRKLDEVR